MRKRSALGRVLTAAAAASIAIPLAVMNAGGAAASTVHAAATTVFNCPPAPGGPPVGFIPAGTYGNVLVNGNCAVNDGIVTVNGNMTVNPGKAVVAAFAHNDVGGGPGPSRLIVKGNVFSESNAATILGCFATSFPCVDDMGNPPSLNNPAFVDGSVISEGAQGTILHDVTVGGDFVVNGGGGGLTCAPPKTGVFALFGSPAYSDVEDSTIMGNDWVTNLSSCWMGSLRVNFGGSVTIRDNHMADPDAYEVHNDRVAGNLICVNNARPPDGPGDVGGIQYGDSGQNGPSLVSGSAIAQCGFNVVQPFHPPHGAPVPTHVSAPNNTPRGYNLLGADGGVFSLGSQFFGSAPGTAEILPYTGIATAPGGRGYWIVNGTGLVHGFGPNARNFGDASSLLLAKPMIGIAAAPGGDGYYLAGGDGGVFNYGPGTGFFGSAGALHLVKPISGIAAAPNGRGYTLVAGDGGVFTYGPGSQFHGSLGGIALAKPIVGIAIDPVTGGYWLVGADGGVFALGAPFFGSLGNVHLAKPIVGIAAGPHGDSYYLVGADGGVFPFGPGAHFQGSLGNVHLAKPIVDISLG